MIHGSELDASKRDLLAGLYWNGPGFMPTDDLKDWLGNNSNRFDHHATYYTNLGKLNDMGLVESYPNPISARGKIHRITSKGVVAYTQIRDIHND